MKKGRLFLLICYLQSNFGKGGHDDHKLKITAWVELGLTTDGNSILAPILVQPDSDSECLLGESLGYHFSYLMGNLFTEVTQDSKVFCARLVQISTIPLRDMVC